METKQPDTGRKASLNFQQNPRTDAEMLHCPLCGGDYLHHEVVTVYSRKEDADHTLETRVVDRVAESPMVPSKLSANPSTRRHGVSITFTCESCPARLELILAQHKGQSELAWRRPRNGGRA